MFKIEYGNWTRFRDLKNLIEIDFHFGDDEIPEMGFYENMDAVYTRSFNVLKKAQQEGIEWVLFTHGHSTSRARANFLSVTGS